MQALLWLLQSCHMLNDRENILNALREKLLKVFEVMKRANVPNQEACQTLLLKMRDEAWSNSISTVGDGSLGDRCNAPVSLLLHNFRRDNHPT